MAQSVIVKRDEKVRNIFDTLGIDCTLEEFSRKFQELYPNDWDRIDKVYQAHEKKDVKGKGHPMPKRDIYISNMFKSGKTKYKKS